MRRTSRGGWLSRLGRQNAKKKVGFGTLSSNRKTENHARKPGKSAPVAPFECRAEHGGGDMRGTAQNAAALGFYFRWFGKSQRGVRTR